MLLKRLSRNGKLGSHSWESWRRRSHSELQIKCDDPTPKLDLQKASHGAEMILGVGVCFFALMVFIFDGRAQIVSLFAAFCRIL